MEREIDLDYLVKRRIIGWICNNEFWAGDNYKCYVYPEYVLNDEGKWCPIPKELFPDSGAIEVFMSAREDSTEFINNVRSVVSITFNEYPQQNTRENAKNKYTLQYNSRYGSNSQIDIKPISNTIFSQIISYDNEINLKQIGLSISDSVNEYYTNNVILECEEDLYGPFLVITSKDELQLKASDKTEYLIGKFKKESLVGSIFDITDDHDNVRVRLGLTDSYKMENAVLTADWMSDEELLAIVGKLFKESDKNSFTKNNIRVIKESLLNQQKTDVRGLTNERRRRVESLLLKFSENEEFFDSIVERALAEPDVLEKLVGIIVKEYFPSIESKVIDHEIVTKEKEAILTEINKLKEEQRKLEQSNEEIIEQQRKEYKEELKGLIDEIKELYEEKEKLEEKIKTECEICDIIEQKAEMNDKLCALQKQYEQLVIRNDEQQKSANKIEAQLSKAVDKFRENTHIIEELVDKELLNRIYDIVNDRVYQRKVIEKHQLEVIREFTAEELIQNIYSYINEHENRKITKNEVINILICITQGFITTFAGEPGTGKTSLCTILGKALGLFSEKHKRMVEISVERGWTSYKDYIGYYNPLTHTLEKSNVEVFDSMEILNSEIQGESYPVMMYLLDEANLSQIEYYWSAFLRICDANEDSNRTINLGGDIVWKIPKHMKFLATVNFDHTTEELSPRFLDRSWVIMLQPENFDIVTTETDAYYKEIVPYDYSIIEQLFTPNRESKINEACVAKWENIQKICREHGYTIMPRCTKMIVDYMKIASCYMDTDSAETRFAPLDYAFSQKVLPLLSGNIDALIQDLLKECEAKKMPLCEEHLKRMIDCAKENMGYYQFFSHKIGG